MSLSVCCLTSDPGPRVAALLRRVRPVADEIVVAADAVVGEEDLRDYASNADRLLRVEFSFLERHLAWLHAQCSCDWILRLDGDEVVSAQLLAQLAELGNSRDVLQYRIPRRWLFPDPEHWLDEAPWWPDYQIRLVRNDGTLRFPGLLHTSASPALPARYLEASIYHLACLVNDSEARRSRSLRYGDQHPAVASVNAAYYLPEVSAKSTPARVPAADHDAIAEAIDPPGAASPTPLPDDLSTVHLSGSDRFWVGREVEDAAYAAEIVPWERQYVMQAGERRAVHFRVANHGSERWPWDPDLEPRIRAAYRWLDVDGKVLEPEGERTPFPCEVHPGEAVVLPLIVEAPEAPGARVLEVDLVHEHVRWFDCPARVEVRIRPSAPAVAER